MYNIYNIYIYIDIIPMRHAARQPPSPHLWPGPSRRQMRFFDQQLVVRRIVFGVCVSVSSWQVLGRLLAGSWHAPGICLSLLGGALGPLMLQIGALVTQGGPKGRSKTRARTRPQNGSTGFLEIHIFFLPKRGPFWDPRFFDIAPLDPFWRLGFRTNS